MLSDKQITGLQYLALAVLGMWLFYKGVVPGWTTVHSDFGNYYVSARLVAGGANLDSLYNDEWFHQQMIGMGVNTPGKFSPFPPITAWMLIPYSGFEPLDAQRLFVVVNLVFVLMCAYAWRKVSGWKRLPSLLMVLAGGASLINNVAFGQMYLVMVTCLLTSLVLIERDRPLPASILLGGFAVIKYFPIVIIAGFFLLALISPQPERRRYHLTVIYSSLTVIVLIVAQLLFFGTGIMKDYVVAALLPHLSSELSGQGMYSYLFQSWDSLGRNLFVYDVASNPDPVVDWPAGRTLLKMFVTIIVLATSIIIMYVHWRSSSSRRFIVFLTMPALALLVILPASATYHFILLLFPLALLLRDGALSARAATLVVVLYSAIGFIPYGLAFRMADAAGLLFAFPRLLIVSLLFFFVAWALSGKSTKVTS